MCSKYLSLYPQVTITLIPHHRYFFLQQTGYYKDEQLIKTQRISGCGVPNPN